MNASNVTGDSQQWEIKSTQGQWHRLAVAALLVLVAICWFLVPGGRAGAAGQGLWTNRGKSGEVGKGR